MKIDSIILYESERIEDLYPFSIMHCGWEVRCGIFKSFEKIKNVFKDTLIIYKGRENHLKSFLARIEHEKQDIKQENLLLLNSNILFSRSLFNNCDEKWKLNAILNENTLEISVFTYKNKPFAIHIPKEYKFNRNTLNQPFFENIINSIDNNYTKFEIPDVNEINYLWDAIELNDKEIINDFSYFNSGNKKDNKFENVSFINKKDIYLGNDCKIAPNVVIDASEGPVIIDNNVKIMPNSVIFGPVFLGKNSIIRTGAKNLWKNQHR